MFYILCFIFSSIVGSSILFIIPEVAKFGTTNILICCSIITVLFTYLSYNFATLKVSIINFLKENIGIKPTTLVMLLYWLLSWTSSLLIINQMLIGLIGIFPILSHYLLLLQISSVIFFIILNLLGISKSFFIEAILTIVKIVLLIALPILLLVKNPIISTHTDINIKYIVAPLISLVFCFFGIECGNIVSVNKQKLKIASIVGLILVSVIYTLNIFAVSSVGSNYDLILRNIPHGKLIFNSMLFLIGFGSSNAWCFASGMTIKEMAEEKLVSAFWLKQNRFGSYYNAIIFSSIGLIPLFIGLNAFSIIEGFSKMLDFCSNILLIFYAVTSFCFYKTNHKIIDLSITILFVSIFFIKLFFF